MKGIFSKKITAVILSAAVLSMMAPALADEAADEAYLHCIAYYDSEGKLAGTKGINGSLSTDEIDTLADLYEPAGAERAKVFEWTKELKPIGDSGKKIDISDDADVVILHTNDMHGALVGSSSVIGSDSVAALKKLDDAILADGGDASQGVALASQSNGEDVITIMNAAGYDVMAAGNHEFDYGLEQFAKLRKQADFPIISANTYKDGVLLCADGDNNGANTIITKNGVKVGIFALTTRDTMTSTKPENLTGVEFKDEIETAKAQVAELDAAGADVIIALTHMGIIDEGMCTSRRLAEAMADTELDAIIDGHSHSVINEKVGNIAIAQTGTASANVGRMEIDVAEDGVVSIDETMLSRAFFDNITPDAEVAKVISDTNAKLSETMKEVIGETKTTLWGGSIRNIADGDTIAEARVGETNFGSLICDAMIAEAEKIAPAEYRDKKGDVTAPIVAIENGGGFRASVPNGKITRGHIINALPYANTVRIREITPSDLYTALEGYVSSVTAQDPDTGFLTAGYSGSFPQIGGMRLRYDPNNPEGEKIEIISLLSGNTDLDRNDTETKLILVSHDYLIDTKDMIAEGSGLVETVIAYINDLTENGTKTLELPVTMGRISTTAHNPDNYTYTAHITLKNAPADMENGSEIGIYLDGEMSDIKAKYNKAEGVLDVTLPDGAHAVKLYENQAEVYVNNYSGNGLQRTYGSVNLGYPELEYNAAEAENPVG